VETRSDAHGDSIAAMTSEMASSFNTVRFVSGLLEYQTEVAESVQELSTMPGLSSNGCERMLASFAAASPCRR